MIFRGLFIFVAKFACSVAGKLDSAYLLYYYCQLATCFSLRTMLERLDGKKPKISAGM